MESYRQRAEGLWQDMMEAVSAFIRELAARKVLVGQPATRLRIARSGVEVLRTDEGRERTQFAAAGPPQQAVKTAMAALGGNLGSDCTLDIAADLSVTSRMMLPAEGDGVLKAIVRNKVESIAPWPLAQSLFAERILRVPEDPGRVAVDIAVVSRVLIEAIAQDLSAAGTTVKAASIQISSGECLHLDIGAGEEMREAWRRAAGIGTAFAACAAAVSAIGMLLVLFSLAGLGGLREEVAGLRASLAPGSASGAQSQLAAANLLHERRRQRPPAIAVMNELSAMLPQSVWLVALSLDDMRIEIKGQGSNIPPLIEALETSGFFSDVNFASATQFDAELNAETFTIGAAVETAAHGSP